VSGDLLVPGSHRAAGCVDDAALVAAMLQVEVAWLRALAEVGALDVEHADRVASVTSDWRVDLAMLSGATEASGNVVVPLAQALREAVGGTAAEHVHRGLTSQDVLDTALVLISRDALARVRADLVATAGSLADLAVEHRESLMVGRTLTQYAVPITFGLKAAQWLSGVVDAVEQVDAVLAALPVQCGGAAGTLALVGDLTADPIAAARTLAVRLDLTWPGVPWHTNRTPVTQIGSALVTTCDVLGVVGADIALLSRPEVAEVREDAADGRGGSSTMPHKHNPVLSVLVRSASLQAPLLGAQLHLAAAQAVDERPDGAWHSEWSALRRLLELSITAASQCAELVAGLQVNTDVMRRRATEAADDLLAERGRPGEPSDYLGTTSDLIDAVLARLPARDPDHG
jgi:3-carboxy-cis,cis-muconate cycloisomerase